MLKYFLKLKIHQETMTKNSYIHIFANKTNQQITELQVQ